MIPIEVMVSIKKEILEIPVALRQMFEEGRPDYDVAIRSASWREKPIFMVGNKSSYLAALSGAWAFENLLGLPVIVRHPVVFSAYTRRSLAVRSLVIAISGSGECEETLQAARHAKNRGAIVWAVTANPASGLAGLADAVVNCYAGEVAEEGSLSVFCQHAVMLFLAVAAARVLKAPAPLVSAQEEELGKLATHVEWTLNQISDAAAALANQLGPLQELDIVGGGPFYPVALEAASRLRRSTEFHAGGYELMEFQQTFRQTPQPGTGILYLSSSRSKLKEQVHKAVRESRQRGNQRIFAVTDGNDRQLADRGDLAVLLPSLTEAGGALLALSFLELTTGYAAQASTSNLAGRRRARTH